LPAPTPAVSVPLLFCQLAGDQFAKNLPPRFVSRLGQALLEVREILFPDELAKIVRRLFRQERGSSHLRNSQSVGPISSLSATVHGIRAPLIVSKATQALSGGTAVKSLPHVGKNLTAPISSNQI
jgi:hypothetical protein